MSVSWYKDCRMRRKEKNISREKHADFITAAGVLRHTLDTASCPEKQKLTTHVGDVNTLAKRLRVHLNHLMASF
jgi:hypothetical protein